MIAQISHDLRLASRNLARNRRRSSFAFLTVIGGIVAYMMAAGFIEWIFFAMREAIVYTQTGHFQVSQPHYFERGIADPYAYLVDSNKTSLEQIRHTPGVASLAPRLAFGGMISFGDRTLGFLGEGIDPTLERFVGAASPVRTGKPLATPSEKHVILGEGLAKSLGVKSGDTVILLVKTVIGGTNAGEYQVVGTSASASKAYDDTHLRLPIQTAQRLIGTDKTHTFVGFLDKTNLTDAVVGKLRPVVQRDGLDIQPWSAQADFYTKTVALFSRQIGAVKLIIAIIIVLSISNTLSMSVLERTQEIGTSLAVGVKRSGILRLFLTESILIGVFGGGVGIALGAALAYLISAVGIPMPPPPGMEHGFTGEIRFSWPIAGDALLLGVVTTLLAGVLPAWRASRVNIVDALRQSR